MATSAEFIEFVCDCVKEYGIVRYRKMFGEYMVYLNEKPVLLVCDNTVFVKKIPENKDLMKDILCGVPYKGAKEHYMPDIENRELLDQLMPLLIASTPVPKKKKEQKSG